ncbi:copper amine oxidase N-terminal domain-containing protein [Ureibacillus sp. GCM10028918]|uniref:copper amine oxidase N-terminal domain-containing protein n=1 Tax=Ureibacillus sp. GCM10028918 TaxID=3273429 RepID=UPI00361BACB5
MKKRMILLSALLIGLALPANRGSAETTEATTNTQTNSETITTTTQSTLKTLVVNDGIVVSGRTLVPLRAISEGLGLDVKWNQKLKQVTIIDGNNIFIFTANSKKVNMNGRTMTIDVPVKIYNGTTYVPLVVAAPQDAKLTWDNKTKIATVTYEGIQVIVNTGR